MFKFINIYSAIILILTWLSCDSIKRKGDRVINQTKAKIAEKRDAAIDKVIPTFDSYKPDTKFNRKRFQEFFGFAPGSDVRELYCYDDAIGIDAKFLFSFYCDSSTKNKIVTDLNLTQADKPDNFSSGLWRNFPWWDSAKIVTLNPYVKKGAHEYYRYLWFDREKGKVYY